MSTHPCWQRHWDWLDVPTWFSGLNLNDRKTDIQKPVNSDTCCLHPNGILQTSLEIITRFDSIPWSLIPRIHQVLTTRPCPDLETYKQAVDRWIDAALQNNSRTPALWNAPSWPQIWREIIMTCLYKRHRLSSCADVSTAIQMTITTCTLSPTA